MVRKMTESIVRSIAWDEGNKNMRKGKRKSWSKADYNVAVKKYNELWKV